MDFMRDLNECQAEVFRRSEQRIKARKRNRTRIMAVCIPLILVVSLWSVGHFPETGMDDSMEVATGIIVDQSNSIVVDCSMVEIRDTEQYYEKITDSAVVFKVNCTMSDFFTGLSEASVPDGESAEDDFSHISDTTRSLGYSITLTDSEGIRTVYRLTGNLLTNTEINVTITLTDDQLLQLKTDLGITD